MSQFENDDIDSFFAEMQDVKPIASDDKAFYTILKRRSLKNKTSG